ncbi:MAG: transcriptional repressor [Candidatus Goldbacteria bacterium]|nr:transcriptional repressor [Candidatus Goldiibacteriota bacterium]
MDNLQNVKDELIKHKIKPSLIRIKVLECLRSTREHPDVEKIYQKLLKDVPTLSRTSIYNALKVMVEKGIIKEIMIEENEIRYDGINERHAHLKCIKCNKLYDLKLKCKSCLKSADLQEVKIFDEHIYLVGICKKCLKKIKNQDV